MDEAQVEKRGISPIQGDLDALATLNSVKEMAPIVVKLQQVYGRSMLFRGTSMQDLENSEQEIAGLFQGGLGLPDRDYYTKEDDKSKEIRDRYVQHVQKVFELAGGKSEQAKKEAETVMRIESAMAKASLTRVQQRDPYNLKHPMKVADLNALAPNFDWAAYYRLGQYPSFETVNVGMPDFFKELNSLLASEGLENWKTYLRFHVVDSASPYLSQEVSARGERAAAALEALRELHRSEPGRGPGTGLCGQSVLSADEARCSGSDTPDRGSNGATH
jgi:predicted metalloendopeptidase